MQEEGWVVCRAFKKPSPNQNQAINGAWINNYNHHQQQAYYDNLKINNNQFIRTPSFSDAMTPTHMVNSLDQLSSLQHDPYDCDHHHRHHDQQQQHHFLPTNNESSCFDVNELVQLPNLESPTLSASFGTNDDTKKNINHDDPCLEWNNVNFDGLLSSSSQIAGTLPSSYPNLPQTCDQLQAQNHCGFGNFC